jgi:hypothetical protein
MAKVRLSEVSTVPTPAVGSVSLFAKTDKKFWFKNSDGDEHEILSDASPGVHGYQVEIINLSPTDILNKSITLGMAPDYPERTLLQIEGAGPTIYNVDFEVVGDSLSWNGKRLDGLLDDTDIVQIIYM